MGQEDLRAGLERKGEKLLIGLIAGGDGHVELEREVHAASIHELAMLLPSPTQVTVTLEKSGVRS